jgi:hypothetical protein
LSIDAKIAEVQAKLTATGATPELSNKALKPLQDLKTRIASQTSIAQILYLQGQGGDAMDDAITLIEAATAKPATHVASPGNATTPVQTGQPNVPAPDRQDHPRRPCSRAVRPRPTWKPRRMSKPIVAKLKAELLTHGACRAQGAFAIENVFCGNKSDILFPLKVNMKRVHTMTAIASASDPAA